MRAIGLLEIIWKTTTKIINYRINENVNGLHGCVPGRGTGTALIETKLAMQLAQRDSRPWYQVAESFSIYTVRRWLIHNIQYLTGIFSVLILCMYSNSNLCFSGT
jgi:hypothetical protein